MVCVVVGRETSGGDICVYPGVRNLRYRQALNPDRARHRLTIFNICGVPPEIYFSYSAAWISLVNFRVKQLTFFEVGTCVLISQTFFKPRFYGTLGNKLSYLFKLKLSIHNVKFALRYL